MSLEEQIELLKYIVEYYAYNTQEYDYGYVARRTLLTLAANPKDEVLNDSGREL